VLQSYYTTREANKLGVTGFIQNDDSGTVSISTSHKEQSNLNSYANSIFGQVSGEAQGSEEKLKEFLKVIKQGPPLAVVSGVDQSDIDTKDNESRFEQYR
jgi:acylphosphatase